MNDKTFCSAPWKSLFVDNRGDMRPCCLYIPQQDESIYPIESGISNYRQSIDLNQIKKAFLNNEKPAGCEVCFNDERHGGHSFRKSQNEIHSDFYQNFLETGKTEDQAVKALDIRLSNICNLKCNMCGPHASILILKDRLEGNPDYLNHPDYKNYSNIMWVSNQKVWDDILAHSSHVEGVHLTGGEPLIIQEAFEFKTMLQNLDLAKNITLSYNTNLTQFSPRVKAAWKGFKNIKIYGSIDASGELNNYIRFPSDWSKIQKNIAMMNDFLLENNFSPLTFHATWQVYNLFQITDLIKFSSKICQAENKFPDIFPLDGPEYYNVRFLPRWLKDEAIEHLVEFQKQFNEQNFFDGIQRLISILQEEHPLEGKYLSDLKKWIIKDNNSRQLDILELEPRLKKLFN